MSTGMAQRRRAGRIGWLIRVSVAALLALALSPVHGQHPAAATTDKVLILGGTVTGGVSSIEATEATADGFGVDIVDTATWSSMTATQFASYRAIILGDPTCYGPGTSPDIDAAAANSSVWGPVINGNVVVLGTDPVYHAAAGGATVTQRGIDFAVAQSGKTGAYISLSCYYHGTAPNTPVPLLNGIGSGGFTVTGVGCYDNAHIVALSPALTGLTDADLSNWSCSVHEAFQTWSPGLVPLAIARDFSSSYTASDGTQGPPYILAGGDIQSFPLSLSPLSDSAAAGGTHSVTAQLLDASTRAPISGATIGFKVLTGPNTGALGTCSPGSCLTNSSGQVTWSYTSNGAAGSDTLQAFYDMNGNASADPGEPQTTAGMSWTANADGDGDGIPTDWEQSGLFASSDLLLVDLPHLGAQPNHKDLFVEMRSERGAQLSAQAKQTLIDSYAKAPVSNPDGKTGITLHLIDGPELSAQESDSDAFHNLDGTVSGVNFKKIFDDWNAAQPGYASVFHLVLSVHWDWGRVLGQSSNIPSQLAVLNQCGASRHSFTVSVLGRCGSSDTLQAANAMHELGHNLGLHHGGSDDNPFKPNYLSVMNYSFSNTGIPGIGVTYSSWGPESLYDLDESSLSEQDGILLKNPLKDGPALTGAKTLFYCPSSGQQQSLTIGQPADWNCDRTISPGRISANIDDSNSLKYDYPPRGQLSVLHPFNDWANLIYKGGAIGSRTTSWVPGIPVA